MFMSLAVGYTFTRMNHPLAMGLTLLFQTLLIALLTGLMTSTFWFSYILFLVFLGGMLVLFIYVTSLASNEMFSISSQALIFGSFTLGLVFACSLFNDPLLWTSTVLTDPFNMTDLTSMSQSSVPELLIKLYHAPSSLLTLLLVVYLFLTLIAVVTITNIFEGPLRSKN
uniref:NADH-ubiquinone oxidoreductase chain 6 n=1 Tax=Siphlonurus sp. MT-2014 TaxID=1560021 RepID=A0A0A0RV38_9INSE|nr:NADH dehydrogenase subunit 6 [Siphlonurus sp. MT-2014]